MKTWQCYDYICKHCHYITLGFKQYLTANLSTLIMKSFNAALSINLKCFQATQESCLQRISGSYNSHYDIIRYVSSFQPKAL